MPKMVKRLTVTDGFADYFGINVAAKPIDSIYPSELKIWSPGCVKALGIVDRKVVNIRNMDHFTIGDSQELSRSLATKF